MKSTLVELKTIANEVHLLTFAVRKLEGIGEVAEDGRVMEIAWGGRGVLVKSSRKRRKSSRLLCILYFRA